MKKFVLLALILTAVSCSTQKIRFIDEYTNTNPNFEDSQAFFIYGVGQTKEIKIDKICNNKGLDKIETKQSGMDVFLSIITFGIYTPRTVAVYCK